jgi:hypothetical protein
MTIDRNYIDDDFAGCDMEDQRTFFGNGLTFLPRSWDLRRERERACENEQ